MEQTIANQLYWLSLNQETIHLVKQTIANQLYVLSLKFMELEVV